MVQKVVTLKNRALVSPISRSAEVWHDQINQRLASIERTLRRLEWQVWSLFCGGAALAGVWVIDTLVQQSGQL